MTKNEPDRCYAEIRRSIPWYINGTLSDADASLVRTHIEECADCRADAESHSDIFYAVRGNAVTPMMPQTRAADIMDKDLSGPGQEAGAQNILPNRRFSSRFAVAAAVAVLAVAALAVFSSMRAVEVSNQQFETATSAGSYGSMDYVLQLRFDNDVSKQYRDDVLSNLTSVTKWSAMSSGDYEVHVQFADASLSTLQKYEELVESIAGVQSAEFTALQLPMR